ncbi:MAG TPA: hydroxysqualene dehydroxylase HpnE [bacterium]|nr:hydroxysqualene dehydroxylase HpnE [bacterium]
MLGLESGGALMGKVLVVGGGFAGVAAATALAGRGHRVELLESRGSLGGRVYSTASSDHFPAPVDNGPHLLMGCYHETLRLFQRIGVPEPFHWIDPLRLCWWVKGGASVSLRCAPLPAPFHLAWGLLSSDAFPWREKISLARALSAFSRKPFKTPADAGTLAQFLDATRQGPLARERFWIPLCNSVMNVPAEWAPVAGLGEVLNRIFFASRRDSALAVPARPLSEMGFPQAVLYLEQKGGAVFFHEGIQSFQAQSKDFQLTSRSGKTFTGDALVWAVPPSSLFALWPAGTWERMESLPQLGKSPIISVHLILSREVTREHLIGLSGSPFEWVFNRNANWDWKGEGQYLSFVASAAGKFSPMAEKELVEMALGELRERRPQAREARVLHSKVTREMAATFCWTRETDALRLPCRTPFPNVFLAGDWTDTGLPATIEGACLSGHRAAEKISEYLSKGR